MKKLVAIIGIFLLLLTGCREETSAVCKDRVETEKPAVLRCPRCFKTSAAEKVESINQQMLLCPECKKVSPAVKFYPRKRK